RSVDFRSQAHRVNDNRVIAVQIENTDFQQCPVTGWSDQHCQVFIHHYASGCRANGMPYIDLDDAVLIRWLPIRTQTIYLVCVSLQRDRKSTRLNSSHVSISYAVFCLKKKNEKQL